VIKHHSQRDKTHQYTVQGLDSLGSKTSILDVSVHVATYSITIGP
jgi:hypothetical protein